MKRLPYLLGATSLSLALFTVSCTTLGGHVKGGFACKAPVGTCAPMSNIDAEAIAGLGAGAGRELPISGGGRGADNNVIMTSGGEPVRTGERTMRVVFPAHSDANGVYHDEAIAHVVAEWSRWALRPAVAPAAGSLDAAIVKDAPTSQPVATPLAISGGDATSAAPQNLREVAAGLSAPADPMPDAPRDQIATDMPGTDASTPTASALAAARAGHRIGQPLPQPIVAAVRAKRHDHHLHQGAKVAPTTPGAATAALNRASLQKMLASTLPARTGQPAGPDAKPRQIASVAIAGTTEGPRQ